MTKPINKLKELEKEFFANFSETILYNGEETLGIKGHPSVVWEWFESKMNTKKNTSGELRKEFYERMCTFTEDGGFCVHAGMDDDVDREKVWKWIDSTIKEAEERKVQECIDLSYKLEFIDFRKKLMELPK